MLYTLSTNNGQGQPVNNATISFYKNGSLINAVPFPNNTGVLYFDSVQDADLFASDVSIRVTAFGYNTAGTTGNAVNGSWEFTMKPNGLNTALLIGGGLGALVMLASTGKRKKVGAINIKNDVLPYVVPAAVVIGGYFVYQKFFGDSPEDKARDAALNKDIAAAEAYTPSRMSDSEISTTAKAIKEDLSYSGWSNNYTDAAHQLTKPGTTADMLRLIRAYGKQVITVFGIPTGTYTLEETVTRQMPADYVSEINAYYDAQNIDFRF